jgi:hypothetical protein
MTDKIYVVAKSKDKEHHHGVFEEIVYDSGQRKRGEEVATFLHRPRAEAEAERLNAQTEAMDRRQSPGTAAAGD